MTQTKMERIAETAKMVAQWEGAVSNYEYSIRMAESQLANAERNLRLWREQFEEAMELDD